jgi:hypothetical protein
MDWDKIIEWVPLNRKAITAVVALMFVSGSVVWLVARSVYEGEIRALKEQVNLVREQAEWRQRRAEELSKQCPPAASSVTPSAAAPQPPPSSAAPEQRISTPGSDQALRAKLYPRIADPSHLTRAEVQAMAEYYDLFRNWSVNPHLRLKTGDVSYWYEQRLPEKALQLEFESRRIVLEQAERSGRRIPTQGDLSALAQEIQASLIK